MNLHNEYTNTIEEERSQLQVLVAAMDDIVFEVDADKRFLNAWTKDESLLFMPRELFIGKTISDVMGPLAEKFNLLTDEIQQTGESQEFTYSHLDPTIECYFKAKGVIINKGDEPSQYRLAISIKDITQQVLQEKELNNIQAILNHSQQLSKTGGWAYWLKSGDVYWTKSTYEIYDIPYGTKITYELALNLYTDEDNAALNRLVQAAIENGTKYEKVLQARNGKWIHIIGEPIFENYKVVALSGAVRDITEKLKIQHELIEAKEASEAAAQANTNFLSVMSHEIRTPLNGIIGIANLLGLHKTPEQEELVDNLIFSANHLLRLVNDILDLNKIQSDKLTLINDTVSLQVLIENIARQFTPLAEAKGIALVTNIDKELPAFVQTDAVRMGQVLNNLINNAVKFTDEGAVTVSLTHEPGNDHTVARIKFSVSDTGMGISEQDKQRIFEPFEQVVQKDKKQSGTGLGLQIAKRLVTLMGGELELDTEIGKGSDFYFIINLAIAEQDSASNNTPAKADIYKDEFAQLRLLLAEDNPVNTLVARKQLEGFGITPTCVPNGKQALELMQDQDFDIALIDLHMPEMDGFELSAQIRKNFPETFIVIFTADITDDAKERINNLNVHDIISKPFVPKEMYNVLLKVWADKRAME